MPVVYAAGALLAAERGDDRFQTLHLHCLSQEICPIVPAPVLAQVWRDGARQARLSRALRGCVVEPTSEVVARNAGVLLGRSGTSDAVDAIVVTTAIHHAALVATSDPDDLNLLWGVSGARRKLSMFAF
ncbi:type II toxin-antitoxin system VapC family toxin [Solihabitans fulvus]|uniref:Type II toxin-antitoxin system VapC family toxin n=2 Tax=Solihabitans fulvus TaxID=1892852 RepID=A0A5B2WE17_9PSEU|nr:type II toxin-antitoxin system VapC family toxin [Solihabitans fulvus]